MYITWNTPSLYTLSVTEIYWLNENGNNHISIMCNANCINTAWWHWYLWEKFFVWFYFCQIKQPRKYFDHKKWNYGIVFVYVLCAVPQYASACNRHKQFSALKLFLVYGHACVCVCYEGNYTHFFILDHFPGSSRGCVQVYLLSGGCVSTNHHLVWPQHLQG